VRQAIPGIAVVVAALTTGCVSTQHTLLNPAAQSHPAICADGVAMFTDSSRVGKPYDEVALLSSTGSQTYTSEGGMLNSQRKEAAKLGANGVILQGTRDAGQGAQVASALFGTPANRRGHALAIYVPGDSVRVREACAGKPVET